MQNSLAPRHTALWAALAAAPVAFGAAHEHAYGPVIAAVSQALGSDARRNGWFAAWDLASVAVSTTLAPRVVRP